VLPSTFVSKIIQTLKTMKKTIVVFASLALGAGVLHSCKKLDAAKDKEKEEPLDKVTLTVSYTEGDNSHENISTANLKSDRPMSAIFGNTSDKISKIEVSTKTNNVTKVCEIKDKDGKLRANYYDWPASTCEYNFTVYDTDGKTKAFGPYVFNVSAPDEVVSGSVHMGDQANDGSGYGSFFQSRHVGWGGGLTNANFYSAVVVNYPRLVDFAVSSFSGQLKAYSPDEIQATGYYPTLKYECNYFKTTFAEYTGTLDPEMGALTTAQLRALPDPSATTTSLVLTEGKIFTYKTGEGKRGLLKIKNISNSGSGKIFTIYYSCDQ
jgi:hypothetical protein